MTGSTADYEVVIIGAGVIGLSVAKGLAEQGVQEVLLIEKEEAFGRGTSSRNSEVIHSGIYYEPNSLKARYCCLGRELLYPFCRENDIWHSRCGKLVIAKDGQEDDLQVLYENAQTNGVPELSLLDDEQVAVLEPEISVSAALFVGCTGIISAHELMAAFYRIAEDGGHDLVLKARTVDVEPRGDIYTLEVEGPGEARYKVTTDWVVNAAGLYSDRVAELLWGTEDKNRPVLHLSKGSYFKLTPKWRQRVQHLVYPLPDAGSDSLGIHISFDANGDLRLGPNVRWLSDRNEDYVVQEEDRTFFYQEAKQYLPALEQDDLTPDFAGIRPKLSTPRGKPSDFYIQHEIDRGYPGWINLIGIDSPGLTAAIAIGEEVASWIKGS